MYLTPSLIKLKLWLNQYIFIIYSILEMKKLASNSRIKCCTLDQVHFELIDHSRKCKATLKTHCYIYWGLAFYDQFTM